MHPHVSYLLVSCSLTLVTAIRVDWNTNKGPIVPPTPRSTVRPLPPYREPAPVWEDQSNDIPNPNPYVYILPPPSRPRPATNNYLSSDYYNNNKNNNNNNNNVNGNRNYGSIITAADIKAYLQNGNLAGTLSPKYIPNVGIKYTAVLPASNYAGSRPSNKYAFENTAAGSNGPAAGNYFGAGNKLQGKYNAKTKKYKTYEKVKYVPLNYYPLFDYALPDEQAYVPEFNQEQLIRTQQLPLMPAPVPFRQPLQAAESVTATATASSEQTSTQMAKVAHDKEAAQQPTKAPQKSTKKRQTAANSIFSEKSR